MRYLAVRIADQQQVIANLVTVDSEQRLGKTLVTAGPNHGKEGPAQHSHRTEDFTRGIVGDGGYDAAPGQLVYAEIS